MLKGRRPPLLAGIAVAVAGVAATTLLVYALDDIAPILSLGVVYLVAVLLVATLWGVWLGVALAVRRSASRARAEPLAALEHRRAFVGRRPRLTAPEAPSAAPTR
jgi:hypothetical protein